MSIERPIPKLAVAGMQLLTATPVVFNTEEWPTSQDSKVCVSVWPLKAMEKVRILVQSWRSHEGSRTLRLSDFVTNGR